jgi:RNA polymerase sigma-70 factor (ECF subfamily)
LAAVGRSAARAAGLLVSPCRTWYIPHTVKRFRCPLKGGWRVSDQDTTLQHWLDRHRAGDPAARNELIRHSQERLRLLTRQMLRGYPALRKWEDTSDVFQNVLCRLDRALRDVPPPSPHDFLCLAAALIRRELIDLARHHFGPQGEGRHRQPPGQPASDAAAPEPSDSSDDPGRLAVWGEVHGYIAALDGPERQLFELLYYQGLTQPQAAALLGVPARTLRRHWQEARLRLMEHFGQECPFS